MTQLHQAIENLTTQQKAVAMGIVVWLAEQPAAASDNAASIVTEIERRLDEADIDAPDRVNICLALMQATPGLPSDF